MDFLHIDDFNKLKLFFANTNLTVAERNVIIKLLGNTYDAGFLNGSSEENTR